MKPSRSGQSSTRSASRILLASNGVTAVNLQGYSSFGRSNGEVGNRDNTWQFDEEFTYNRAGHSLAFGTGLRYRRGWHLNGNAVALGSLSFQPVFTAQLAANSQGQLTPVAGTGDSFADFLLGFPANGMLTGLPVVQFRANAVYSVLSGHLEAYSRSDSELWIVLVFRDAAGSSGLGAGSGA